MAYLHAYETVVCGVGTNAEFVINCNGISVVGNCKTEYVKLQGCNCVI